MDPQALAALIAQCVEKQLEAHRAEDAPTLIDIALERPRSAEHGDWATSVALKVAKSAGVPPRDFALALARDVAALEGVAQAEVAGPGFINITLEAGAAGELVSTILHQGESYGHGDALAGQTINVEFVSANPTGPLHIGHTRWAALGDSLVRVLRSAGAEVTSEFYVNDAGAQMDTFGASILAAIVDEPTPENGYHGSYIKDLAQRVLAQEPGIVSLAKDDQIALARDTGYALQLADIKASLAAFGVEFGVWFSERTLHEKDASGSSLIDGSLERLRAGGHVFDEDDAVWVRTTDFGDDKDRVIRRANGVYTYFAADAAYYLSKTDRGFAKKIYLLGADHHGYIHRLKALAGAAGEDPEQNIEILIGQLVSINGAKLSKRAGNIIELDDLREWLGVDALRYSLARYPADSPLSLDPEILTKRSNDNPVFYVQYAHARTHQVARNAAASGVSGDTFDPSLLSEPSEAALISSLADFPRIVVQAAQLREPHRVARYLEEVAALFHRWYDQARVTPQGDDPIEPVHHTRLSLNNAAGQVLRNGLSLLGVSAPKRM
ncbi:arginine--tRNA ligase [Pontimonas sp.]|nr:arginine--tRNA ligase [Pontimonas sp.]MDB4606966.1 arginine--tRNA ligase [Pontimonas sp.]